MAMTVCHHKDTQRIQQEGPMGTIPSVGEGCECEIGHSLSPWTLSGPSAPEETPGPQGQGSDTRLCSVSWFDSNVILVSRAQIR